MVSSMYASLQPLMCTDRRRSPISTNATRPSRHIRSVAKPYFEELQQQLTSRIGDASNAVNSASQRFLDAFADATFTFRRQPLRPSEGNFAPVEEIGEIAQITEMEGEIPTDFPEGVYIRNVRPKFGGFAKICLEERKDVTTEQTDRQDLVKVEYHHLDRNQFCSGATFVPKVNGASEHDGWLVSFVHDEATNISKVHIIDTQRFECGPIAKITLPQRVPYGFHGAFVSKRT